MASFRIFEASLALKSASRLRRRRLRPTSSAPTSPRTSLPRSDGGFNPPRRRLLPLRCLSPPILNFGGLLAFHSESWLRWRRRPSPGTTPSPRALSPVVARSSVGARCALARRNCPRALGGRPAFSSSPSGDKTMRVLEGNGRSSAWATAASPLPRRTSHRGTAAATSCHRPGNKVCP